MGIGVCRSCGVPKRVGRKHEWKDTGVIVARQTDQRGVWMESGLLETVLGGIEEQLGIPIDHIIIDAKRRGAKLYVDNILTGPTGMILRFKLLRRAGYTYMIKQAEAIGLAQPKISEYRAERSFVLEARFVYHDAIFTGDVCGAFESIEGIRARPSYERSGEYTTIRIEAWENAPEEERLQVEYATPKPAQAGYSRCPVCGTPQEIAEWRWDPERGKVMDSATGEWLIFIDIGGLNAVFRELENELGEEIPRLIADLTREFYSRLRNDHRGKTLEDLSFLKIRGFGVPESGIPTGEDPTKGTVIRNPFNASIVAGAAAAVCCGEDEGFDWKSPEDGVVEVSSSGTRG